MFIVNTSFCHGSSNKNETQDTHIQKEKEKSVMHPHTAVNYEHINTTNYEL